MTPSQITIDLESRDPEITRLERHSYVNVINVVHAELQLIERMIERPGALRSAIHLAETASRAFKESRVARRHLTELIQFGVLIESDLQEALAEAGKLSDEEDVSEACGILRDVLPGAHLRVQEVIARHDIARPVEQWEAVELTERLSEFGADLMIEETSQPINLPQGLVNTLATLAEQSSELDRLIIRQGDPFVVVLELAAPSAYFEPLTRRMRPSELHPLVEEAAQPLRGVVELAYFAHPTGTVTVEVTETYGDSTQFAVRAELAEPDAAHESD